MSNRFKGTVAAIADDSLERDFTYPMEQRCLKGRSVSCGIPAGIGAVVDRLRTVSCPLPGCICSESFSIPILGKTILILEKGVFLVFSIRMGFPM